LSESAGADWASSLQVKPTMLIGLGIALGFPVLFLILEKTMGPSYADIVIGVVGTVVWFRHAPQAPTPFRLWPPCSIH